MRDRLRRQSSSTGRAGDPLGAGGESSASARRRRARRRRAWRWSRRRSRAMSSIRASSAPAALAWILARIEGAGCCGGSSGRGSRAASGGLAARDQREAARVVDRRLVLGQHDQRRAGLVEPRVHAAGDLHAARQRQPDVDAVASSRWPPSVRRISLDDRLVRRDLGERQRQGRAAQPVEVLDRAGRCGRRRAAALPRRRRRPAPRESNGLTPASSRCTSWPLMLTIRSRLRSSNFWSIGDPQARSRSGGQLLVVGQAFVERAPPAPATARVPAAIRLEAGRASTVSYQCFAQTPSVRARPAGQDSIARRTGRRAPRRAPEAAARILQHVAREHDRRRAAGRAGDASKISTCCGRPVSASAGARKHLGERGEHLVRVADQEGVGELVDPAALDRRQQVVGHVLLVADRAPAGDRARQPRRPGASRSRGAAMTSSRPGWRRR